MDHHNAMVTFVAVAEHDSLAAAARHLKQSAPTITRVIAALEKHLSVLLLDRNTRGVRLTDAGARYLADCQRILQEVTKAERSAAGLHSTPQGQLIISVPLLFGRNILMPIILDFIHAFPAVNVRVICTDRFPKLHEEGVDIALLMGDLPDSALVAVKVGEVRRVVCASPGYLERAGNPNHPHDLATHKLLVSTADSRAYEWHFVENSEELAVNIDAHLSVSTNAAAIAAAVLDGGITRAMSYQLGEQLTKGQLQLILTDFEASAIPMHVVYREGRRAAARVRSFVDFSVKRLREIEF